jgi:3-methyladenine DNA glycosylase AlkD
MTLEHLKRDLERLNDPSKAKILSYFFKTGPGQYGEGDLFRGINVPSMRGLIKKYVDLSCQDVITLLHSAYHEDRFCALLIFVKKMEISDLKARKSIYDIYLSNTAYINNWDLVDASAEHIPGAYLFDKSRQPLYNLVESPSLWERRIAVLSTFHYIKKSSFSDSLKIIELLLDDKEDLIHKATGWMLREIGKRDHEALKRFLMSNYTKLPRTTLRYAIERFPEELRKSFLKGDF